MRRKTNLIKDEIFMAELGVKKKADFLFNVNPIKSGEKILCF